MGSGKIVGATEHFGNQFCEHFLFYPKHTKMPSFLKNQSQREPIAKTKLVEKLQYKFYGERETFFRIYFWKVWMQNVRPIHCLFLTKDCYF